jgi:trehalose-phosphatase
MIMTETPEFLEAFHALPETVSASPAAPSAFLKALAHAPARALLLDYDGTLAAFHIDPGQATPYPGIPALLRQIQQFAGTRLAIVTGRRAQEIPRLLGLKHLEVWGCHGQERLYPDGTHLLPEIDEASLQSISEADELLDAEGISDLAEMKPAGIAIHWRGREELADEVLEKVRRVWSMLPTREGLRLATFDGGIEIRADSKDKGDVVRTIFAEMDEGAAMAYLGDDATDEDAFQALKGRGLSILVGRQIRPTLADAFLRSPDGVTSFLKQWLAACGVPA